MSFMDEVELAAGNLRCKCGNVDWREFLYVGHHSDSNLMAGCKKCGRAYRRENDEWTLSKEPK